MADHGSQFVSIHTLTNRFEADILMDALQKEGIPAFVRSFEETPYDGLFLAQRGWGLIMVVEEFVNRAKEVIGNVIQSLNTRALFSSPSEIDPMLWEELRNSDFHRITTDAQVQFNADTGAYTIPFLNSLFLCFVHGEYIEPSGDSVCDDLDFNFYLTVLHYLLEAQPVAPKNIWISEKDIPGGELFFRGHHRLPVDNLKNLFGERPELFQAVAETLGGTPEAMGDLAFRFGVLPRVPLTLVLWKADDEFDSEFKVLFDQTIHSHLRSLDTIWAMVGAVGRCMHRLAKRILNEESS